MANGGTIRINMYIFIEFLSREHYMSYDMNMLTFLSISNQNQVTPIKISVAAKNKLCHFGEKLVLVFVHS